MYILITFLYISSLLYLFLFSLGQVHLTWIYLRKKPKTKEPFIQSGFFEPSVTIQLPVYNEKFVIERLIDAIVALDYPKEKMEIQILDDSTDETTSLIHHKLLTTTGKVNILHLHRKKRSGFKAGALEEGLQKAKGEFIVIFDSDFIPTPDFLQKTLPFFKDESVGAVQTRWGHLNKDHSLLTQLQAFGLDAHFSIEQSARYATGSFMNFNGTCGIWRKQCVIDAGGWSADTLTEDLDLSYRAQLKGWKFKYLEDIVTPGELPVVMPVIKSQQYRWNKGAAETAKKLFGKVMLADIPVIKKIHAFFHLFNSSVFVALLVAALSSIPVLYFKQRHPEIDNLFQAGSILLLGFLSISIFYWTATKRFHAQPLRKFVTLFPLFIIVSMGLCLHNGLAVLEGFFGYKTPFIRTPKFNIVHKHDRIKQNSYYKPKISLISMMEGLLCLYFIFGIVTGIKMQDYILLLFHSMLAIGFGTVFYFSLRPLGNV